MEEGSLRIDANVSVKKKHEKELRPKIEIKNLNSFNFLEHAIDIEIERQIKIYESNKNEDIRYLIKSSTYRYDSIKKDLFLMREKDSAEDYRYFPEPDLVPIVIKDADIEFIKKSLKELPHERYEKYIDKLKLNEDLASILVNDKKLSDYFEEALKDSLDPILLCNILTIEITGKLKETNKTITSIGIPHKNIASLVNMITTNEINKKIAKSVIDEMIKNPQKPPLEIVKENPLFKPLDDEEEIEKIVLSILSENSQSIEDFLNGKDKALGFLVGQVMKKTKGKASPEIVNKLILKKIKS
ncbi:MAG: hypothetical protein A3F40_04135 [Chlamydiae bacterium RIFCSPHIGHO2_12_FULL_27_8]|nr:MAG: hypothetical protein A3F40_04135 [Chlamydiae bacterium RIFCSPHIGHO2_12_FULL_27_8]